MSKCTYPPITAGTDLTKPVDIRTVSDKTFLEKATSNTLEIYQSVMDEALKRWVDSQEAEDEPNADPIAQDGSRRRRLRGRAVA